MHNAAIWGLCAHFSSIPAAATGVPAWLWCQRSTGSFPFLKASAKIWGFLLETQYAGTKRECPVCSWMVPETQLLILGEVMPQCPVLHILRAVECSLLGPSGSLLGTPSLLSQTN